MNLFVWPHRRLLRDFVAAVVVVSVLPVGVVFAQSPGSTSVEDRGYGAASASGSALSGVDRGAADAEAGKRGSAVADSSGAEQPSTGSNKAQTFPNPKAAVKAFVDALRAGDRKKLDAIFGPAQGVLYTDDEIADRSEREMFLRYYDKQNSLADNGAGVVTLVVGESSWPFPIPIVKQAGGYVFDTATGAKLIVHRRIGRNELGARSVCAAYVGAQKEYASVGHDGLPAGLYAQALVSDAGKQNGLFWPVKDGEPRSPVGPLLAHAADEGYRRDASGKPKPYHGYLFRTLTAQGERARGGAKSYLSDGKQSGGFALVAYPAEYGRSGVRTFIVNQDGIVYEKDLGAQTAQIAGQMREFNPEGSWSPSL